MDIKGKRYAVQGAKHEPFPISSFEFALFLAREPWISPEAAFRRADNVQAFRGQIRKRSGISRLTEISDDTAVNRIIKYNVTGVSGLNRQSIFRTTADEKPVINSIIFDDNSGAAGATIYAVLANEHWNSSLSLWSWDVVAQGTQTVIGYCNYDAAGTPKFDARVYWARHPLFDAQSANEGYISYWANPETEIVGLFRFKTGSAEYYLACDPDYCYKYDPTGGFYKLQGFGATGFAGPFTGGNTDYFWFWPSADGYALMTNNKDPVCKWDPTLAAADSVLEMPSDWVTPGTNELDTAMMVFQFAGRLVYINTVENTTRFPTRARWTAAGTSTGWRDASDYTDAPREMGAAVTGEFIGERLFIGFEKGWMELVRRPGDAAQAFEWRPFISRFGAVSKLSTIKDSERLLSRSHTSMQNLDPNGQTYLDVPIPDLLLDFSTKYTSLCASVRYEKERSFYWSYVSNTGTKPNNILCAVYDEKNQLSWSLYDIRSNVFSTFDQQTGRTWNQLGPATLNSYAGQTPNSLGLGAQGTSRVIGGQTKGIIYLFDDSLVDNYWEGPEAIEVVLETQKLFPYPGQRSHFGWLDLYIDASTDVEMKISFFADEENAPYRTKTFNISPAAGSSKAYQRISVQRTALFHKFKIENSDGQPFAIDALIPWFRAAGRVRKF